MIQIAQKERHKHNSNHHGNHSGLHGNQYGFHGNSRGNQSDFPGSTEAETERWLFKIYSASVSHIYKNAQHVTCYTTQY